MIPRRYHKGELGMAEGNAPLWRFCPFAFPVYDTIMTQRFTVLNACIDQRSLTLPTVRLNVVTRPISLDPELSYC